MWIPISVPKVVRMGSRSTFEEFHAEAEVPMGEYSAGTGDIDNGRRV